MSTFDGPCGGPVIPLPPVIPLENAERKALPLWDFLMGYFPRTFVELTKVAVAGNAQHLNGDSKIRWAREKSTDQLNTAMRHEFDYGTGTMYDTDGRHHLVKAIWRLCAQSELDLEAAALQNSPLVAQHIPCAWVSPVSGQRCKLSDNHPGDHKLPKPRICTDCGVDLDEQMHAMSCLRSPRQHW